MAREDIRNIRTRKLLRVALTELLKEKTFDKISVNEIAIKADVSRITFYKHYRDKYDILRDMMMYVNNMMYKDTVDLGKLDNQTDEGLIEYSIGFLRKSYTEHIIKTDLFCLLLATDDAVVNVIVRNSIQSIMTTLIETLSKDFVLKYPMETVSSFLVGGIANILISKGKANDLSIELFDNQIAPLLKSVLTSDLLFLDRKPNAFFN